MGFFDVETQEQKKKKEEAYKKTAEEKIKKAIELAEGTREIPVFENKINSLCFMKSNRLKSTAAGTISGQSMIGAGEFLLGKGGSTAFAKANEIKLALANVELLEIIIRQNEEIIKLLKSNKK